MIRVKRSGKRAARAARWICVSYLNPSADCGVSHPTRREARRCPVGIQRFGQVTRAILRDWTGARKDK